jgi:hypothetical protein
VHLIEVERRRLHLGLGYPSMFEYCLQHLGYSASAAARRIRSARCVRDYPEVYRLLEKNEVTLITISLVAPILEETNAKDLIGKIRGKSQREVEAIVASYRPPVSLRDRARPVTVALPASSASPTQWTSMSVGASAGSNPAADSVGGPPQATAAMQAQRKASSTSSDEHEPPSPRLEQRFHVQFLASERFIKKLEKAKALLSNRSGNLSYEFVLEAALDEFLKDHDPEERNKRRETRREKTKGGTKPANRAAEKTSGSRAKGGIGSAASGPAEGPPRSSVQAGCGKADGATRLCKRAGCGQVDGPLFRRRAGDLPTSRVQAKQEPSRRIPAAMRDAVFARNKGRCTHVGSTGKRCDATQRLQIDHILPYARGGIMREA